MTDCHLDRFHCQLGVHQSKDCYVFVPSMLIIPFAWQQRCCYGYINQDICLVSNEVYTKIPPNMQSRSKSKINNYWDLNTSKAQRRLYASSKFRECLDDFMPNPQVKTRTVPCDDQAHCQDDVYRPYCPESPREECPGLSYLLPPSPGRPNTPTTYSGRAHHGDTAPSICSECILHGQEERLTNHDERATAAQHSGPRAQLCKGCTYDEMKLYHERCVGIKPWEAQPDILGWTAYVGRGWPRSAEAALGANTQDLCLCTTKYLRLFRYNCHACRDAIFNAKLRDPYHRHEHFLRERTKAVIKGEKLCSGPDGNGGTKPHRVRPAVIDARVANGIGRMCPCGEKPVDQDFIDICLVCMGVRVIPDRIPTKYQKDNVLHGRVTRSSQQNSRTKGPARAERSFRYRVNIERGYLAGNDPELDPLLRDQ